MERILDFKPLERLVLPDLGELKCAGLVLIVGPNSSGKSQLLQDINLRVSGEPRKLVVAEKVDLRKPEYEPFLKTLEREGYLSTFYDDAGALTIRPKTAFLGTGSGGAQIAGNQAQSWHSAFTPADERRRKIEFLNYFGRMIVMCLLRSHQLVRARHRGLAATRHPDAATLHTGIQVPAAAVLLREGVEGSEQFGHVRSAGLALSHTGRYRNRMAADQSVRITQ